MSPKPQADTLVQLDPGVILMEDNARFSTEVSADEAEQMCASINEVGRIMQPVGVTVIPTPTNGFQYKLRYGFRRVAGAMLANERAGAAVVKVPAIILHDVDTVGTLKEQVGENVIRKTLSLMDTATAAQKMLDAGMSRTEVRAVFTRPAGTKGGGVQPASNAWLNMVLGLLKLPKTIQGRIHAGDIGLASAYRLMKAPPDKRETILEAAEKVQADIRATEEREEKQFEALETKLQDAEKGAEQEATTAETLKAELEVLQKGAEEKIQLAEAAYTKQKEAERAVKRAKNADDKKKAKDAYKAATEHARAVNADAKAAEKLADEAEAKLERAADSQKKLSDKATELRTKLEAKRAAASKPKKAAKAAKATDGKVSPKAIDEASKAAGVDTGKKKLTGPEMRKTIEELKGVKSYAKVAAIGEIILRCFNSDLTPGQMVKELATLTGEAKPAAKK